jgi:hypothetical protein
MEKSADMNGICGNKVKKNSYIEAFVTPDSILLYIYGDLKLSKKFKELLFKYGIYVEEKFCSPCG